MGFNSGFKGLNNVEQEIKLIEVDKCKNNVKNNDATFQVVTTAFGSTRYS